MKIRHLTQTKFGILCRSFIVFVLVGIMNITQISESSIGARLAERKELEREILWVKDDSLKKYK